MKVNAFSPLIDGILGRQREQDTTALLYSIGFCVGKNMEAS